MKRTPLPPRTKPLPRATKALVRHALLKNRKPIRAKGKSRFPHRRAKWYTDAIKQFPCVLTGFTDAKTGKLHVCLGPIDPAHIGKTRGAGADDIGCVVPMDRRAHDELDSGGLKSFEARFFPTEGVLQHYARDVYPAQVAKRIELGWVA